MGWMWSRHRGVWVAPTAGAPREVIGEEQYGGDAAGILYFPNVRSCTTVTVRSSLGELWGLHFTYSNTAQEVQILMQGLLGALNHARIEAMWLVGAMDSGPGWTGTYPYGKGMRKALRGLLGLPSKFKISCYRQPDSTARFYRATLMGANVTWGVHLNSDNSNITAEQGRGLPYLAIADRDFSIAPKSWF